MDELDLNMAEESIVVGKVTKPILDTLNLSGSEKEIVLWKDRIRYLDKHRADFPSDEDFEKHIKMIPLIIKEPEYVGLHPKGDSVQFIKRIDEIMLVGIRVSTNQRWSFRSAYPITQEKFDTYLQSGSIKKVDCT